MGGLLLRYATESPKQNYCFTISSGSTSNTRVAPGLITGVTTIAIGDAGQADQLALAADLNQLYRFGPTLDDLVERKRGRFSTLDGAVEDGPIGQGAMVMDFDRIRGLGSRLFLP